MRSRQFEETTLKNCLVYSWRKLLYLNKTLAPRICRHVYCCRVKKIQKVQLIKERQSVKPFQWGNPALLSKSFIREKLTNACRFIVQFIWGSGRKPPQQIMETLEFNSCCARHQIIVH